jgi:hypothetical protein
MRHSREELLKNMLSIIKKNPDGIRPSKINRALGIEHSASLRNALIKKGLIRKIRKGSAVYYYPR